MSYHTFEDGEKKRMVVIHRDLPGIHAEGRDCWCCPHIFEDDGEWWNWTAKIDEMEAKERKQ